jgi:hypothetical protein
LEEYQQGKMTLETKLVFEALLKEGPLDTISLRKAAHLTGKNSNSPFNNALDVLQMQLRLLPVAISEAGRWGYAFVMISLTVITLTCLKKLIPSVKVRPDKN